MNSEHPVFGQILELHVPVVFKGKIALELVVVRVVHRSPGAILDEVVTEACRFEPLSGT